MYVYLLSDRDYGLFTVGFYDPTGKWHAEQDCSSREEAAARVHWLNGGNLPAPVAAAEAEED